LVDSDGHWAEPHHHRSCPAVFSPPQSQQATVLATSTALDLAAVTPQRWIAQGATISIPLTVQALDLGAPLANVTVNFTLIQGTASLSAASATTNASGFATVTANLANLAENVRVTACVAPNNVPARLLSCSPRLLRSGPWGR